MTIRFHRLAALIGLCLALGANTASAASPKAVIATYADLALAKYQDSLNAALVLKSTIDDFLSAPSAKGLDAAKRAWIDARVPYQQSEVYRFGNAAVDEWEGKVNAWPLDEGLIDYVSATYGTGSENNKLYTANVIANPALTIGGRRIDARVIDTKLIRALHEIDDVEANVATGYHAIEFLLWGQDLNGTGPGAGARPWTDYSTRDCTGGNCDRRAAYLRTATALLVSDLEEMVANWRSGGAARAALTKNGETAGLAAILRGMGSLSYGELAGERMQLGLILHDPEEEHDCFSDNTHNSHYYDALGIRNVYLGRYRGTNGKTISGASLSDLVKLKAPGLDREMRKNLDLTIAAMDRLKGTADRGEMSYDQMIGEGNTKGNAIVQSAIDRLRAQTKTIEKVVGALGLGSVAFEGSDSLDNPSAVFK